MSNEKNRGFTLLEVLIALLVLSISLLGVAALQAYSVKANQSAHFRSQVTALTSMIFDSMRANRGKLSEYYDDSYADVACEDDPDESSPGAYDLSLWRKQIACQLPGGRGAIAAVSSTEVAVCIRWTDARWEEESEGEDAACTTDAETYGATEEENGSGSGSDGQFAIFTMASQL